MSAVRNWGWIVRGPVVSTLGVAGGLLVWELIGRLGLSPAFPPVTEIVGVLFDVWISGRFRGNVVTSLTAIGMALPPSVLFGILLGVLMGRYRVMEWAFDTYVNVFLSLPLVALIPILLLIFGLGRAAIVSTIVIYTFFVVVVNTFSGVRTTDAALVEMARSYGADERRIVYRIVLPSAMPLILAGVRIATGRAIKGVIIGEQVIGLIGLGGMVQRLGGAFAVKELYAVILFIGLLGLVSMESVRSAERFLLPWIRHREQADFPFAGG
jgi:ABC-type nitrate/sulfonate/bicarbonate transport system permease component